MTDITAYCGLSEKSWGGLPARPGRYVCVSPVSGRSVRTKRETCLTVPVGSEVIQDSGAFSDSWSSRLTFEAAYKRQIQHAEKYSYAGMITHRATYDLLIDEVWVDGNRSKRRWSVAAAESAVDETVNAAAWLDGRRDGLGLVVSAQGVDAAQYLRCAERVLPFFREGDKFGLGGWCIIGKMSRVMMPVFRETVALVLPFLAREGVRDIHIWGVIYPPALVCLLGAALAFGLRVSTDSAGISLNPVRGQWGFGSWRDNRYERPADKLLMAADRARHVDLTSRWLSDFSQSYDFVTLSMPSHFPDRDCHTLRPVDGCHGLPLVNEVYSRQSVTVPICLICGGEMIGKRQHTRTCSDRCRKALSRMAK